MSHSWQKYFHDRNKKIVMDQLYQPGLHVGFFKFLKKTILFLRWISSHFYQTFFTFILRGLELKLHPCSFSKIFSIVILKSGIFSH